MRKVEVMAGQIRIDPEQMRMRAKEYHDQGAAIRDTLTHMNKMLVQLRQEWQGAASTAYADKFQYDLRPHFEQAIKLTDDIASALEQAAQQMYDQDQNIARGFGA